MKKILFFVMVSLFATHAMASDWVPGVEVLTGVNIDRTLNTAFSVGDGAISWLTNNTAARVTISAKGKPTAHSSIRLINLAFMLLHYLRMRVEPWVPSWTA